MTFDFKMTYTPVGIHFYVTIMGLTPFVFMVKEKEGRWSIVDVPQVPQWIYDAEDQVAAAICEFIDGFEN